MSIKHVLIVDDSKAARLVLKKMLQSINLGVDMVASGEEALSYLAANHPDAIFMDHTMPGMDGLQTVQAIKSNEDTARIPVAMYTSKDEEGYIQDVLAHGAVGILPKPATQDTLSSIINQLHEAAEAVEAANAQAQMLTTAQDEVLNIADDPQRILKNIEKTVQNTAESVVNAFLQRQVMPLFEEKLTTFKQNLLADQETAVLGIAGTLFDARIKGLIDKLRREFEQQLVGLTEEVRAVKVVQEAAPVSMQGDIQTQILIAANKTAETFLQHKVGDITRQVANSVYDERAGELSSKLAQQLNKNWGAGAKPKPETTAKVEQPMSEDMRHMVQTVASTMANRSAQEVAEKTASDIVNKIMKDVNSTTRSVINRMYVFSVLMVFLGVTLAGALVYYIK